MLSAHSSPKYGLQVCTATRMLGDFLFACILLALYLINVFSLCALHRRIKRKIEMVGVRVAGGECICAFYLNYSRLVGEDECNNLGAYNQSSHGRVQDENRLTKVYQLTDRCSAGENVWYYSSVALVHECLIQSTFVNSHALTITLWVCNGGQKCERVGKWWRLNGSLCENRALMVLVAFRFQNCKRCASLGSGKFHSSETARYPNVIKSNSHYFSFALLNARLSCYGEQLVNANVISDQKLDQTYTDRWGRYTSTIVIGGNCYFMLYFLQFQRYALKILKLVVCNGYNPGMKTGSIT